jgi:hypothetical protein
LFAVFEVGDIVAAADAERVLGVCQVGVGTDLTLTLTPTHRIVAESSG